MALEIERKFLLHEYPQALIKSGELAVRSRRRIEQTYLAIEDTQELRVRRITDLVTGDVEYTQTFKRGHGISREEIEYSISEGLYEQLTQAFLAVPLTKERTTADLGSNVIEIDEYDQLELLVVEVEFDSIEEALQFEAPDWFGEDISQSKRYSNKTVWRELQQQAALNN
ncbi:CYTH domain-containing protein [Paenibacillus sepulcri]|uniref:CYTH domain-containing protein n=1 Tax=Paenibacillus sepulcri TaxID=359917 RepID=A0ABS7C876_9BACL|nr:CYTH domain-containing protein [Paenibacillus sepulcri]